MMILDMRRYESIYEMIMFCFRFLIGGMRIPPKMDPLSRVVYL